MKLIPLTPDLLRFDSCGRLVPPEGHVFLDLFRVIPARLVQPIISEGEPLSSPVTRRVTNQSGTVFYALGLAGENAGLSFSLRWPSGRSLSVRRSFEGEGIGPNFPLSLSNRQWCFESPVPVGPGDPVTLECPAGVGGSLDIQLWGYLRWLLTVEDSAAASISCNCLVGYPVAPMSTSVQTLPSGVSDAQSSPRYSCDPVGQNLMATAAELGNQCYTAEPCMFASDPVTLGQQAGAFDVRVQVPFVGTVWLVGVRLRVVWANWPVDATSDIEWSLRMPDAFQVTGADALSNAALGFIPIMPSIPMKSGDRLSFDLFNRSTGVTTDSTATVVVEFHCRRAL